MVPASKPSIVWVFCLMRQRLKYWINQDVLADFYDVMFLLGCVRGSSLGVASNQVTDLPLDDVPLMIATHASQGRAEVNLPTVRVVAMQVVATLRRAIDPVSDHHLGKQKLLHRNRLHRPVRRVQRQAHLQPKEARVPVGLPR